MGASAEGGFLGWVTYLVRQHRSELVGIARQEGLLAEDALDAVQDALATFLDLPHARKLADEVDDSRLLLSVLVRNHARNRRRRHAYQQPHLSAPEVVESLLDERDSVEALIERAEQHLLALGCVQRLRDIQRKVITLRLLEEQPGVRVAQLLGTTAGNVAVILHRAKSELRECMDS